jgi:hypothetical protein
MIAVVLKSGSVLVQAVRLRSGSTGGIGHPEAELEGEGSGRGPDVRSIPSLIDSVNDQLATINTNQPPTSHPFMRRLITPRPKPHGKQQVCQPNDIAPHGRPLNASAPSPTEQATGRTQKEVALVWLVRGSSAPPL